MPMESAEAWTVVIARLADTGTVTVSTVTDTVSADADRVRSVLKVLAENDVIVSGDDEVWKVSEYGEELINTVPEESLQSSH